jgi:3alpha(or 20beta)-hydroxysteroid dehydrogenase
MGVRATDRLLGKVAVITGGARGMGTSHVRTFVKEGARVICSDLRDEEGMALENELGRERVRFVHHDITKASDWEHAIDVAEQAFGPISILVNNAGIVNFDLIENTEEATYRRTIEVNQIGTFLGMKAVIGSLRRAGGGSIVNISSTAGFAPMEGLCAYAASKFAIRGMTKVAALEFGRDGVRVNSVHPGGIDTPMNDGLPEMIKLPIPRRGKPEEVSDLVVFLAGDASAYCTGSEFIIDGGMLNIVGEHSDLVRRISPPQK